MDNQTIMATCPKCGAKNRVPSSRWKDPIRCGKCRQPLDLTKLYPEMPVNVTDTTCTGCTRF